MARGKARVNYLGRAGLVASQDQPDWGFIYEASKIKSSHYNLGDKVVLPDGRVFRYAKAGASLESMKFFVLSANLLVAQKGAGCVIATGGAAVGDKSVTLTVTPELLIGPGDNSGTGILAEDELRGGYISFYGSSSDRQQRGIIGNTALAAAGTSITIYLDAPVTVAMAAAVQCEILANPYSDVRTVTDGFRSTLGVPAVLATTGQYFWIQTWGICRVTPDSNGHSGYETASRQFISDQRGVAQRDNDYNKEEARMQHVGFIVERTDGATVTSAAPFVNLQINP